MLHGEATALELCNSLEGGAAQAGEIRECGEGS